MATTERSVLEYRIDISAGLQIPEDVAKLAVLISVSSDEVSYAPQLMLIATDATELFFRVPQDVDVELRYGFADDARDGNNQPKPNISWSTPVTMRSLDTLPPPEPTVFGSVSLVGESKEQVELLSQATTAAPLTPVETSTLPPWIVLPVDVADVTLVSETVETVETATSAPVATTAAPEVPAVDVPEVTQAPVAESATGSPMVEVTTPAPMVEVTTPAPEVLPVSVTTASPSGGQYADGSPIISNDFS